MEMNGSAASLHSLVCLPGLHHTPVLPSIEETDHYFNRMFYSRHLANEYFTNMSGDTSSSILVVVLDTNPVWWGKRALKHERELYLSHCLDAVIVFCNSYLMLSHQNKLALLAAHSHNSKFLYPVVQSKAEVDAELGEDSNVLGSTDGQYELFSQVDNTIKEQVQDMILHDPQEHELHSDSLIAGAMSRALCYIHRITRENSSQNISARILVIKGSEDNPSQYLNFMNVIFTAQKQNITIDACILDHESSLLQQASDITGGVYLKLPQLAGLLQYLLWVFLPDAEMRKSLTLPPKVKVDYRAACFCHRNLVDIGYVCSVCLSIFCTFSPICSTCQTRFKFLGPPKLLKKKGKKS